MSSSHKWFNPDENSRRCIYCDIRWHPSRDDELCQANTKEHNMYSLKEYLDSYLDSYLKSYLDYEENDKEHHSDLL